MKANELRIGNLLKPKKEYLAAFGSVRNGIVTSIQEDKFTVSNHYPSKWFEPIPITEEWLLKIGFEFLESSSCKHWHIGINDITHDWLFDLVWLKKPQLIDAPDAPFYRNGRHNIYYVHQLQNLYFALTGEELEIKE